jgi:hypothetical protein
VIQAQERADGGQPSPWAPLRSRVYRDLFIAQFGSNIGTWMQTVAAQWFLVQKHSGDVIVALVQTASLGPTLLLGLFAGVLADLFDRRRLLIFLQSYAVLVALALAVLTYLGRLVFQSLEVSREYGRLHHPSGESAPKAHHYADPVPVVTAYTLFHATASHRRVCAKKGNPRALLTRRQPGRASSGRAYTRTKPAKGTWPTRYRRIRFGRNMVQSEHRPGWCVKAASNSV